MVYTLGEILLDVVMEQETEIPPEAFIKHGHPGGAMLNAAVSLARSNVDVSLISEIGDDETGRFLLHFLNKNNIETKFIRQYPNHKTSVALARLDSHKKPTYSFYKSYPSQRKLITPDGFTSSDSLLFGSLYALDPQIRPEIRKILHAAAAAGALIIYDPNIRKPEQLSHPLQRKALEENLQIAHIIKGSDEDFTAIFGKRPVRQLVRQLQKINPEALLFITLGENGAMAIHKNNKLSKKALQIPVTSTVGAGDGFNAGIITALIRHRPAPNLPAEIMNTLLETGVAFSAAVCRSKENYIPEKGF